MRMNLLCFVHSIAHTNGITGKIKQRKRNKTIIFLLTNQCSFLTLQNKFGEQKPTVFLLNGVYFLKSHLRPKLEELLLWFVLLECLFCWGQKEGGRGSRRKKDNDEEEAIPEEGELKRGHRLQALQGGWPICNGQCWTLNQCLMDRFRKMWQESCSLWLLGLLSVSAMPSFLPTQRARWWPSRALAEGWVFSQV